MTVALLFLRLFTPRPSCGELCREVADEVEAQRLAGAFEDLARKDRPE